MLSRVIKINPAKTSRVDVVDLSNQQLATWYNTAAPEDTPPEPSTRTIRLYSQRDPRWRDRQYAGGVSFGRAGCYTVCVAMIASLVSYDDPPAVAKKLRDAGCYSGAYLTKPGNIPYAYPGLQYDGPFDVSEDGPLRWHNTRADLTAIDAALAHGPVIAEVDFVPVTDDKFNQHFVVIEGYTAARDDLLIADPWDGTRTKLLERYALDSWSLERALFGVRLLRVRK